MADYKNIEIKLENLLLDVQNPRYVDVQKEQLQAIHQMVESQGYKLVHLAEDIINKGLNPSELPIVIPDEKNKNKYIVLEGNRRVTALKLLMDPTLASNDEKNKYRKRFEKLKGSEILTININVLLCTVYQSREEAQHWIEIRHTGENQGRGIVRWDTGAKERFEARTGQKSIALQVMEIYEKYEELTKEESNQIKRVAHTNVKRLIQDPDVRRKFGLELKSGEVKLTNPGDEVIKPLRKVYNDLLSKNIKVGDIYTKDNRKEYLETFSADDLPKDTREISSEDNGKDNKTEKKTKKRSKPTSIVRKNLIPSDCVLSISHKRINDIYLELKRIEVDNFPNAAAITMRVFLEVSVDYFIQKNGLKEKRKLYEKIKVVADYFENEGILTDKQLKFVRMAIDVTNKNLLFTTNTLNAYVHNKDINPIPADLKKTWDNMQIFIETIWRE